MVLGSTPALAEEGVFTGSLGGGAAFTLTDPSSVQGLISLSGRYGLSDHLNLELPADLALGGTPLALLVGLALEDVGWQNNHWRVSAGGGLAADYSFSTGVPWGWGPFAQLSVRWLTFWGVGFSVNLRALVPVAQGLLSPIQLSGPSPWRIVLLPTLSVYEEL